MSGLIRLKGDNRSIGRELGKYWGNYFAALYINRRDADRGYQRFHYDLYDDYYGWLTDNRNDLAEVQTKVKTAFLDLWEEIEGMYEGLRHSNLKFASDITLSGLFACIVGEADESACSTAILSCDTGYTMVHSKEDNKYATPLVAADILLCGKEGEKRFFSISHPFQLLGSAAGHNSSFAVQGNSIGCVTEIREIAEQNIPKTFISRKILEMNHPKDAANLYRLNPCSLPNNHLFITSEGVSFPVK